jgi:hypothetical protein
MEIFPVTRPPGAYVGAAEFSACSFNVKVIRPLLWTNSPLGDLIGEGHERDSSPAEGSGEYGGMTELGARKSGKPRIGDN